MADQKQQRPLVGATDARVEALATALFAERWGAGLGGRTLTHTAGECVDAAREFWRVWDAKQEKTQEKAPLG